MRLLLVIVVVIERSKNRKLSKSKESSKSKRSTQSYDSFTRFRQALRSADFISDSLSWKMIPIDESWLITLDWWLSIDNFLVRWRLIDYTQWTTLDRQFLIDNSWWMTFNRWLLIDNSNTTIPSISSSGYLVF